MISEHGRECARLGSLLPRNVHVFLDAGDFAAFPALLEAGLRAVPFGVSRAKFGSIPISLGNGGAPAGWCGVVARRAVSNDRRSGLRRRRYRSCGQRRPYGRSSEEDFVGLGTRMPDYRLSRKHQRFAKNPRNRCSAGREDGCRQCKVFPIHARRGRQLRTPVS